MSQFWDQRQKFIYYLIALSVTVIGFTVVLTKDESLTWNPIPLGVAIICWGLSIHFGLEFLRYNIGMLARNQQFLSTKRQIRHYSGSTEDIKDVFDKERDEISNKTKKIVKWQTIFFYSGVGIYLIGHVIKMYYNN